MGKFLNTEEYIYNWLEVFKPFFIEYPQIEGYCKKLLADIEDVITSVSPKTFWKLFPRLLGIDARLALLGETVNLLTDDDLTIGSEEIISWIETDYVTYTKEICGYNLSDATNGSLIFQVA
ncbi:DUF7006 family protein [Enterococcus sp. OL5]|uniref:DUF7006 family protein n=1 Tax=Enterococcus sp. OL5 TaxID=2590214 RepID=UPI00112C6C70|nr:hypothetical protein [Enterococcus sp. OL5]TPR56921.1 hypothetical protein FJU10_11140 [Enterococcus sp. OL5]